MTMKLIAKRYGGKKEILATGDHYVALGHKFARATSENPGQTELIDERRILRVGTIFSVDGVAVGLVADDYDLTDGDANVAVIVHGVIDRDKLPVAPTYIQEKQMSGLVFVGGSDPEKKATSFYIDIPAVANATVTAESGYSRIVPAGGDFKFKVTAAASHSVTSVSVDGEAITADEDGVYTIESVDADKSVSIVIA